MSVLSQRMQEREKWHARYALTFPRQRKRSGVEYVFLCVLVCTCLFYRSDISGILQHLQSFLRVFH